MIKVWTFDNDKLFDLVACERVDFKRIKKTLAEFAYCKMFL